MDWSDSDHVEPGRWSIGVDYITSSGTHVVVLLRRTVARPGNGPNQSKPYPTKSNEPKPNITLTKPNRGLIRGTHLY